VNVELLPDEPEHQDDPRWAYAELTKEQTYAAWPCKVCRTRRDEHADTEVQSAFPSLDITDHEFVDTLVVAS